MNRSSDDTDPTSPELGIWDRAPDTPLFNPGDRVAGRFEILRFLGAGGMGHVYAVHDLELRDDVALKMIRPEIARSEKAMERFRREIQLSRRVTHPNVCRVYDVFWHRAATGEVALVSMELLEGQTLASRLRGGPRLTPGEALPLAQDMAA
ncbi:MAG TPA: protein kinase, partial [Vicinamibacteria bacterium]|nr:protein kinase [Vicinamibacteria bacterium]